MIATKFKLGDALTILLVITLAFALFLGAFESSEAGTCIEVSADGNIAFTLPLAENDTRVISSEGYTLTIVIFDGEARVSSSDCGCGICTAHKPISKIGESIVCIPAGIVIKAVGDGNLLFDGTAG